jgi:CrcB protein
MSTVFAVALGGALGSVLRHAVNHGAARWIGLGFPWGTFLVNLAGCFLMGVAATIFAYKAELAPAWRAFFATGFLGGFTTFSAFSLDFAQLAERGALAAAVAYLVGSVALAILGFYAGAAAARWLLQ